MFQKQLKKWVALSGYLPAQKDILIQLLSFDISPNYNQHKHVLQPKPLHKEIISFFVSINQLFCWFRPPHYWHALQKITQCKWLQNCCLVTFSIITMLVLLVRCQGQCNCFFSLLMKYPVYKNFICFLLGKILPISVNHGWLFPQRDKAWENDLQCSFLPLTHTAFYLNSTHNASCFSATHRHQFYHNASFLLCHSLLNKVEMHSLCIYSRPF